MLPIPMVLAMLASMATLNQLALAQAVSTASTSGFISGALAGGAAGIAGTAAVSNPGLLGSILSAPLRLANAPFYYLLGGAQRDARLRT